MIRAFSLPFEAMQFHAVVVSCFIAATGVTFSLRSCNRDCGVQGTPPIHWTLYLHSINDSSFTLLIVKAVTFPSSAPPTPPFLLATDAIDRQTIARVSRSLTGRWAEHLSQLIENKTTSDLGGGSLGLTLLLSR
jgi:hypothetical protein